MAKIEIEVPDGLEERISGFFLAINNKGEKLSPEEKWFNLLESGGIRAIGLENQDALMGLMNELDQLSR